MDIMDGDISYSELIDSAMREVVRNVLIQVSEEDGLPGEHHFYISFSTLHSGVEMSEELKTRYPEEITIVLQHQFWDFLVEEDYFTVTLSFNGTPEKLVIPFAALTAFADPSVKFGLQFQQLDADGLSPEDVDLLQSLANASTGVVDGTQDGEEDDGAAAEIISLDSFRNNK